MAKSKKQKQSNQQAILKSQIKIVKPELKDGILTYSNAMTVSELAEVLECRIADIVKIFFLRGQIINVGTLLDEDQIKIVCDSFEYIANKIAEISKANFIDNVKIVEDESKLHNRPPVITIMGHVDHGKTTLLDTIRKSNIASSESGGITQQIGAYQINYKNHPITFIDTPGHAAFTEMRARGASITDIVIIVIAADDGLKQQTKEAIDHAKAAEVPIIVFINKTDKPNADIEKAKAAAADYDLMPEEWGGETIFVSGSALNDVGIDNLLDNILVLSEICELRANKHTFATGVVLESHLDKGIGPVATLIIKNGTLHQKDFIVIGSACGRVRNLYNSEGKTIKSALPSAPVKITGLNGVPKVGNKFMVFEDSKFAKTIANERKNEERYIEQRKDNSAISLADISNDHSKEQANIKTLNLIIKSDTSGVAEALVKSIQKIKVSNFKIKILRHSAGTITDSDVILAKASKAIIYGFNVRPTAKVKKIALDEKVEIRLHSIIYKVTEEIEQALKGMLEPVFEEKILGQAEVRAIFKFSKIGTIAGCRVSSGLIRRDANVRVLRDGVVIYTGLIASLKFEKNDIKESKNGKECGITIKQFNDIKEGDLLEAYVQEEVVNNESN